MKINKSNLLEALKAAMESNQQDEPETKKVVVGKVPFDLVDRVRAIDEAHDLQHEELQEKLEAYTTKLAEEASKKAKAYMDQLEREHKPECLQSKRAMSQAWDEIHDLLGLPESERANDYQLNGITGEVTKKIPIDSDETETVTLYN